MLHNLKHYGVTLGVFSSFVVSKAARGLKHYGVTLGVYSSFVVFKAAKG